MNEVKKKVAIDPNKEEKAIAAPDKTILFYIEYKSCVCVVVALYRCCCVLAHRSND